MTAEGGSVAEGARLAPWRPTDDPAEVARRRYELAAIEARVNDAEAEWLDALERNAAFRARYLTAVGSLLQAVLGRARHPCRSARRGGSERRENAG